MNEENESNSGKDLEEAIDEIFEPDKDEEETESEEK